LSKYINKKNACSESAKYLFNAGYYKTIPMKPAYTLQETLTKKEVITAVTNRNIHVSSLEELNDSEKIEELFKNPVIFNMQYLTAMYLADYFLEIARPVYITKDDSGKESIMYNSNLMEGGKLYEIDWQGEKWALKKTDKDVEFMKFESEEK
jgi:hypothetical protein